MNTKDRQTCLYNLSTELGKISLDLTTALMHVVALTVLANIGKCFPLFCYKNEATVRERLALCVAMFPRGEVGAGVLLVALSYGLGGVPAALAGMSLALNLLLTGGFIAVVIKLLGKSAVKMERSAQ